MSALPTTYGPTRFEVALEVAALYVLLEDKDLPALTSRPEAGMPDINADAILAQVHVLQSIFCRDKRPVIFKEWPGFVMDHAMHAKLWLEGDELEKPSAKWDRMIEEAQAERWTRD